MIERIIELVKAGYKIEFESEPFQTKCSLRVAVSKGENRVRRVILFDELNMSCLPAETIVLCHINNMLDELIMSAN